MNSTIKAELVKLVTATGRMNGSGSRLIVEDLVTFLGGNIELFRTMCEIDDMEMSMCYLFILILAHPET